MLQPSEYRAFAQQAYDDVEHYETEAETADEPRRSTLLAYARNRQDDAEFMLSRAFIAEQWAARQHHHSPKTEERKAAA